MNVDGRDIKMQIWDTAGQERFRTITQSYYKGAQGIVLAYDCTNAQSFENVTNWLVQIEQHANSGIERMLVATKCDRDDRKITAEQGLKMA